MDQVALKFPCEINGIHYHSKGEFEKHYFKSEHLRKDLIVQTYEVLPLIQAASACLDTAYDILTEDHTMLSIYLSNIRHDITSLINRVKKELSEADHTDIVNKYL